MGDEKHAPTHPRTHAPTHTCPPAGCCSTGFPGSASPPAPPGPRPFRVMGRRHSWPTNVLSPHPCCGFFHQCLHVCTYAALVEWWNGELVDCCAHLQATLLACSASISTMSPNSSPRGSMHGWQTAAVITSARNSARITWTGCRMALGKGWVNNNARPPQPPWQPRGLLTRAGITVVLRLSSLFSLLPTPPPPALTPPLSLCAHRSKQTMHTSLLPFP